MVGLWRGLGLLERVGVEGGELERLAWFLAGGRLVCFSMAGGIAFFFFFSSWPVCLVIMPWGMDVCALGRRFFLSLFVNSVEKGHGGRWHLFGRLEVDRVSYLVVVRTSKNTPV